MAARERKRRERKMVPKRSNAPIAPKRPTEADDRRIARHKYLEGTPISRNEDIKERGLRIRTIKNQIRADCCAGRRIRSEQGPVKAMLDAVIDLPAGAGGVGYSAGVKGQDEEREAQRTASQEKRKPFSRRSVSRSMTTTLMSSQLHVLPRVFGLAVLEFGQTSATLGARAPPRKGAIGRLRSMQGQPGETRIQGSPRWRHRPRRGGSEGHTRHEPA